MTTGVTVDAWDQHGIPLFGHPATKVPPWKLKARRRARSKVARASKRRNR